MLILSPGKRRYLENARRMVQATQDPHLPPCDELVVYILKRGLKHTKTPGGKITKKMAEFAAFNVAADLLDSPRYRDYLGLLTDTGRQLLHICNNCLPLFLEWGYLTQEEYERQMDFVIACDLDFEKYSLLPKW